MAKRKRLVVEDMSPFSLYDPAAAIIDKRVQGRLDTVEDGMIERGGLRPKLCPFCGEEPTVSAPSVDHPYWTILCDNDDCRCVAGTLQGRTLMGALGAWNYRRGEVGS